MAKTQVAASFWAVISKPHDKSVCAGENLDMGTIGGFMSNFSQIRSLFILGGTLKKHKIKKMKERTDKT